MRSVRGNFHEAAGVAEIVHVTTKTLPLHFGNDGHFRGVNYEKVRFPATVSTTSVRTSISIIAGYG